MLIVANFVSAISALELTSALTITPEPIAAAPVAPIDISPDITTGLKFVPSPINAAPLVLVAIVKSSPVTVKSPLNIVVGAVTRTVPSVPLEILSPFPKVTSLPVTVRSPVTVAFPAVVIAPPTLRLPDVVMFAPLKVSAVVGLDPDLTTNSSVVGTLLKLAKIVPPSLNTISSPSASSIYLQEYQL